MISNIKSALPQYGISQADIIYEAVVEGGITRLFAVFQDFDAEKIGPIRSARHYYMDFALDHDAIYTHVGQSTYATDAFKKLKVNRFYGLSHLDELFTFLDPNRVRPHSTFTSYDLLMNTWDVLDYPKEVDLEADTKLKFTEWTGEENLVEDIDQESFVHKLSLDYSGAYGTNPEFIYNEDSGTYDRYQYGEEHIDALFDEQLSFENIIIQYTSVWAIKGDPYGCMDMSLIAEGEGMYIADGLAIPITWIKTDHYSPTHYFTEDGEPLLLNPGKTFISVYPKHRVDHITME